MQKHTVGILHPGKMGISLAASAIESGCEVFWVSQDRSPQTHERAEKYGLQDAGTVENLCRSCSILISVCPPHAAEDVAEQVLNQRFTGIFLDANAISPQRAVKIGERMQNAGIDFMDGGIVGPPAWEKNSTWLYLAGKQADHLTDCFKNSLLETIVIGEAIGRASALKICYAAWTKGGTALLSAILAAAENYQVRDVLEKQWEMNWPGFPKHTTQRIQQATAKAWRFAGEMEEISATLEAAGLPGEFHQAAVELYKRLAHFKDSADPPSLTEVIDALIKK